jgi:outer membrane lipoprotein SlyB
MRRVGYWTRWGLALLVIAPLLEGCAPHLPTPIAQTSPLNGRLNTGTIVSVRQVSHGDDEGAITQIFTALGRSPVNSQNQAVELVIRRQDNSVTSIVQQQQPGQPSFTPGESVAIVEAAATIVRPE